jgi:hypothetical protein
LADFNGRKPMRILTAVLFVLALAAPGAFANTVPIPGQGATITIPDDWTLMKRPDTVLVAAAPGEVTALGVVVVSNLHEWSVDDTAYLQAMEQGYLDKAKKDGSTVKVTDAAILHINGVPAAFVETEQLFPGNRTLYSQAYNVAANGKYLVITLDTRDPFMEPTLKKIAQSLHFDQSPQLPGPFVFLIHRLGEIGGVIVLLAVAAWGLRLLMRRYMSN